MELDIEDFDALRRRRRLLNVVILYLRQVGEIEPPAGGGLQIINFGQILGAGLMLNYFAYLATSVTDILWPQYERRSPTGFSR